MTEPGVTLLRCLVLPHEDADGPSNMARDEAMLDFVGVNQEVAVFRTYGWTEPTLSLGYFQSALKVESDPRWKDVLAVRRPTGGGAIWHDREITYALAIPRTHPLSGGSRELYREVHRAIAGLLKERGVDAARRGGESKVGGGPSPLLCFKDKDPEDLVVGASKVVGSAQRRRAGAVLQHGSLLLGRSARTPDLPGASDLGALTADVAPWSEALGRVVPETLGYLPVPAEWPAGCLENACRLESEVYRNPDWMRKR